MGELHPVTEVPDVVGLGAEDACAIVRAAGLEPYGPKHAPEPTSGVVTAQRPIGNAGAVEGSPVFLWTQGGKDFSRDVVIPEPAVGGLDPA